MSETGIEARQVILSSIRQHLAASTRFDAQVAPPQAVGPRPNVSKDNPDLTVSELFRTALEAVSGRCATVHNEEEAAFVIQGILADTKVRRFVASDAPLVKKILGLMSTEAVLLDVPNQSDLFDCDLGITAAQWAIAETGTLVLESERERHRLASLVPPVHVAIIQANRIRRTMSEVLRLIKESDEGLSRTVTFITGPSRTSDIELTLAIGVHGPGQLHVIVIDDAARPV